MTWSICDYIEKGKFTAFGFCAGVVIGITVITPASGIVQPLCAFPFAISATILSRWGHIVKLNWAFDDTLDVFIMHGFCGICGTLLTGIFAQKEWGGIDAGDGGMVDGNYIQILVQLADIVAGFCWSFSVSFVLLSIMNKIPALKLRLEASQEDDGMDLTELGITMYEHVEEIRVCFVFNIFSAYVTYVCIYLLSHFRCKLKVLRGILFQI